LTVNSYFVQRSSSAVLSVTEKSGIATSISTLQSRLDSYFTTAGDGLSTRFTFGSYTRGTILPRADDQHSDIDFMVVFEKGGLTPQSYLTRLKNFVDKKYSTSEIYQSSPTIVLELNHIKFELVPALAAYFGTGYRIPKGTSEWQNTDPNDFNSTLETVNKNNSYLIKPAIRLAKIWNAANGYVFDSYLFEKWIADRSFWDCFNQRDHLFKIFDGLSDNQSTAWRNEKIRKAKERVANIRGLEADGYPALAELDAKKLIPE
jgi:predicted nucleotidyltransferase